MSQHKLWEQNIQQTTPHIHKRREITIGKSLFICHLLIAKRSYVELPDLICILTGLKGNFLMSSFVSSWENGSLD